MTRFTVVRYDPTRTPARYEQQYEVSGAGSVLSALFEVFEKIDPTLAFRHSRCCLGVCACCTLMIDDKPARACVTMLHEGAKISLHPSLEPVRDLVGVFKGNWPVGE